MGNNFFSLLRSVKKKQQNQHGAVDFVFDKALRTQGGQVAPGIEIMIWNNLRDSDGNSVGLITVNNGMEFYVIEVGAGVPSPFRNILNSIVP